MAEKTLNSIKKKKTEAKPKEKPKAKPKPKPKSKAKPKPKEKPKERSSGVIVQITPASKENNEELYSNKLKHILFKIKNQNNYSDAGIRFAWKS